MVFKAIRKFGKSGPKPIEEVIKEEEMVVSKYEVIYDLIKSRRSVRDYTNKKVSKDVIEKILDSVRYAPSAGNYQPWEMIVVENDEMRKNIVNAASNQEWMINAPVFIVACVNDRLAGAVYGPRGKMLYGIQGVSAAIENILLTAESLGLGTCWVGAFGEVAVARLLQCPEYVRPCAIITLGYPKEKPHMPARQSKADYLHYEEYGENILEQKVRKQKKPVNMQLR